ncbi:MAG: homocysteine S-methyltransferase family protein, partial [Candidatus Sulfotelmatobacter sp.]
MCAIEEEYLNRAVKQHPQDNVCEKCGLEPYGTYSETDFIETFKEQATYLHEGHVDGFIIETVFDLREAICALKGCKAVSSLPVIVCITFNSEQNGGRTIMGDSAHD